MNVKAILLHTRLTEDGRRYAEFAVPGLGAFTLRLDPSATVEEGRAYTLHLEPYVWKGRLGLRLTKIGETQ